MNEKIASENLFKAKAVGEVQVSVPVCFLNGAADRTLGRNRRIQVRSLSTAEMYVLSDADEECGRADDRELRQYTIRVRKTC